MSAEKWKSATTAILAALDIQAEYVTLGIRMAAAKPRATGWLPCHAMGREDKSPSAEINVGDGPARGRYRDFGSGSPESLSLFDFAAAWGPAADWKEARNHYAEQTGIKLPAGDESARAKDKLELRDLTAVERLRWSQSKQGVTPDAIARVGARGARWPRGLSPHLQQSLLVLPMFGHGLLDLDPVAYHSAPLAGKHIRKYTGKGNEPELIRTMTLGPPGLMNVWAIRHLFEAEVVWLVEGLSDMLALQSLLGDRRDHVVISCGGASCYIPEDCCQHLAGKDVRIVFDNDDAGVTGSQVQVGRVVDVAAAVRNIHLPAGTKDLRDWINSGHGYAAIWEYSQTFPPIEPVDLSEQLAPHQALLENIGLVVCGQLDGTESVEVYSRNLHKITLFRDLNRLSLETAVLAAGAAVEEHVVEGAHEASPGKSTIKALRRAIAKEGGRRLLTSRQPLGCGIWRVGESVVLVGPHQADVFTPSGDLEPVELPAVGDQRLNFNGDPWYDRAELKRNLQHARQVEWCIEVFFEVQSLFAKWDNWVEELTPQLVAGLVGATWIQTLWPFRPLVAVLGPTNCGKTLLLEETLPPMFGGLGFFCQKPTEAGLRQNIGDMSKAVFIDEFEKCQHREKILELLRTTSRGGQIPRGSTRGKGMLFGLRHIVWTGAIELNLPHAADRNRFILFHLKAIPKGPAKLFPPKATDMRDLGQRLLAVVLRHHRTILEKGDMIRRLDVDVFQRALELYAVPLAVIASVSDMGMADIVSLAKHSLRCQHGDDEDSDEAEILQAILESYVPLPRGQRHTVSQLLDGSCGQLEGEDGLSLSRGAALEAAGVRIIRFDNADDVLFLAKGPICRHLLTGTEYRNTDISQTLARIDGAKRVTQRLGGRTARGVSIPSESLKTLVGLEISALTLF